MNETMFQVAVGLTSMAVLAFLWYLADQVAYMIDKLKELESTVYHYMKNHGQSGA